ncbi:PREDICTED: F-box protein SKIP23-like [Nelumbo nucifera]|uniref:F-box protein SKIP23-like n=1 Tax=Nelumbo nucifera TaxID=4432 RepID=A0A1U7YVU8_NELNU|nr:PREDICTED: F-box protein SKIP23-like [Nelumbo nucifera]
MASGSKATNLLVCCDSVDNGSDNIDWSKFPKDLLEEIVFRLVRLSDHINFASVCTSWRSVAVENRSRIPRQIPLVIIPGKFNKETRAFFSLYSGKTYGAHLPELHRNWCCGSSEGWLVIEDDYREEIFLLNPFSRAKIQLPSLSTFSDPQDSADPERLRKFQFVMKAILSSNPDTTSNYVVMAIMVCEEENLSFWRPGNKRWKTLTTRWDPYEDIIYHNGLFYALSNQGPVVTVDIDSDPISVIEIAPRVAEPRLVDKLYLVESLGDLILVLRIDCEWQKVDGSLLQPYKTVEFQGYKLDRMNRRWMKIKSIGDQMLFLSDNCSMSLSSRYFPECSRGDSIYFNDDYSQRYFHNTFGCRDTVVFDLADKSFYKGPPFCSNTIIWVTPQPW